VLHATAKCVLLLLLLLLFVITFLQGIYSDMPEANHVYRVYSIMLQLFCSYDFCYT
jgi:hypothetical protein